jgi:hypothetical protein
MTNGKKQKKEIDSNIEKKCIFFCFEKLFEVEDGKL